MIEPPKKLPIERSAVRPVVLDGDLSQRLNGMQRGSIPGRSRGKNLELLGQGWIRIEGKPRLPLTHHVNHLDAGENDLGACHRLEAEHGSNAALDAPMVLFDPVTIRHE